MCESAESDSWTYIYIYIYKSKLENILAFLRPQKVLLAWLTRLGPAWPDLDWPGLTWTCQGESHEQKEWPVSVKTAQKTSKSCKSCRCGVAFGHLFVKNRSFVKKGRQLDSVTPYGVFKLFWRSGSPGRHNL